MMKGARTFVNHCDVGGSRPTGKVCVTLGRFDLTEPPRTTVNKGDAGIQGRCELAEVQLHRTSSNHCDVLPHRTSLNHIDKANRAGSSEFRVVEPHRTSSNHCHTGKVRMSSG